MHRELRPALTPGELENADDVYRHAVRAGLRVNPNRKLKAVLRCNQLAPDNAAACDWSERIESRAETIERDSKRRIFLHVRSAHPYLTERRAFEIVSQSYVSLQDIGG